MRSLALFRPRARRTAPPAPKEAVARKEALWFACALPEPERRALVYVWMAGLSYADVARLMECEQPDVRRLIYQAHEHLDGLGFREVLDGKVPS